MICDTCGKDTKLFLTSIEGSNLNVCESCSRYGKKIRPVYEKKTVQDTQEIIEDIQKPLLIEMIVPDFSKIIKQTREKLNYTQEQFAKLLNEKTSLIQSIENNKKPSISLAKKIENKFKITLIKEYYDTKKTIKTESIAPTIGNMIKIKKRKKR